MGKAFNLRSAVKRWEVDRSPNGRYSEPYLADDYGAVHAVLFDDPNRATDYTLRQLARTMQGRHEPYYIRDRWEVPRAMCGLKVRVIFPMGFDPDAEEDACPECRALLTVLSVDPDEYVRQVRRIDARIAESELRRQRRDSQREAQQRFIEGLGESAEIVGGIVVDPNNPDHWVFPHMHEDEPPDAHGNHA